LAFGHGFIVSKCFLVLHDNVTFNGTRRGVFTTIEEILGSNDPHIEVLDEPEWTEASREGIEDLGMAMIMMFANSVEARELIARASSRILGLDREF